MTTHHRPGDPSHWVALVTGATSGIGKAIAVALAKRGALVWLVGRRPDTVQDVATLVAGIGGRARSWPTDLRHDEEVDRLSEALASDGGRVDVLVHSAGIVRLGPAGTAPVEDLDRQYRLNLRAPYLLTQRLLPLLVAAKGQVVFINSQAGLVASPNVSQYATTKFGLRAFADSLRAEVNPQGVRVLSVYPGRTATPMQAAVHQMEGRPYDPSRFAQPEDVAAMVMSALLLPRSSEVTDLSTRPMRKHS
jgi:NAD(P)-dependent dehydrogenase (short-subunit alcohol dehydrogenase family)